MSTVNIAYKKCICDACGKYENIEQSNYLPRDWENIKIGSTIDLCDVCFTKVCVYLNSLASQEDKQL